MADANRAVPEARVVGQQGQSQWFTGASRRPDVDVLLRRLGNAADDGLAPQTYAPETLATLVAAAERGGPPEIERADAALSRAAQQFLTDLRTPSASAAMVYTDDAVAPPPVSRDSFAQAARMNPIYEGLRTALARDDGSRRDLILANLERARALPADPGDRFILVNTAAATLWLYEGGRIVDTMPVVVGKPRQPTPAMAGMMRFAIFQPYWNVPPDLVRDSIAPKMLADPAYFEAHQMEALNDWSDEAQVLDPAAIDWQAVADGRQTLRVRQRPGPDNMMGEVKFMFPNNLGIYLHDTPNKAVFADSTRAFSAGCVRLADARRIARRLFGDTVFDQISQADQHVDLPRPIPVYIVYLTAMPGPHGLWTSADIYGRDRSLIAELKQARRARALAASGRARAA